ncbi:MAG: alkaline phosphatase family protein, partial [Usitatibacter sp.]
MSAALVSMHSTSHAASANRAVPQHVRGVVAGAVLSSGPVAMPVPAIYPFAKVCADSNDNGVCDDGEDTTSTDSTGAFDLMSHQGGAIVAEVNGATTTQGMATPQRLTLRAATGQLRENTANAAHPTVETPINAVISVTPLSTEIVRMMEMDSVDYATAKRNLAVRLDVALDPALSGAAPSSDGPTGKTLVRESALLGNRFALATRMVERHDVSPAALAANPNATGPAISMKEAQHVAMELEGIPRYDHLFVIMLENKATTSIKNSPFAPKINAYLNAGNQFTSYFSTGNPSEPNRLAVGAGDDFGITDDSASNCMPAGDTADAMEDAVPAGLVPCTNAANHNIKGKPNLFNALAAGGMTWRVYSESMNPYRDVLLDGAADPAVTALDRVYTANDPVGAIGTPGLVLPFPAGLYKPKHNSSVNFQNVRNLPDFRTNNRTMGGGQWDESIKAVYPGWEVDQLGKDLASGDVGELNFLEPDQCDDMHNISVQGTVPPATTKITASDCAG